MLLESTEGKQLIKPLGTACWLFRVSAPQCKFALMTCHVSLLVGSFGMHSNHPPCFRLPWHLVLPTKFRQIHRPFLLSFFPVILKHLYDADIVEEDALLAWASETEPGEYTPAAITPDKFKALHEKAKPFTVWLQQADEEDGGDDEDDEDEVKNRVVVASA